MSSHIFFVGEPRQKDKKKQIESHRPQKNNQLATRSLTPSFVSSLPFDLHVTYNRFLCRDLLCHKGDLRSVYLTIDGYPRPISESDDKAKTSDDRRRHRRVGYSLNSQETIARMRLSEEDWPETCSALDKTLDKTSDPKKYDVIIRSDEDTQGDEDHPGNLRMVGIVKQHAAEYQSARDDDEKRSIVTKIQKEIENVDFIDQEDGMHHSYTARFLKPLGNGHYSLDPDGKDIEKEIVCVIHQVLPPAPVKSRIKDTPTNMQTEELTFYQMDEGPGLKTTGLDSDTDRDEDDDNIEEEWATLREAIEDYGDNYPRPDLPSNCYQLHDDAISDGYSNPDYASGAAAASPANFEAVGEARGIHPNITGTSFGNYPYPPPDLAAASALPQQDTNVARPHQNHAAGTYLEPPTIGRGMGNQPHQGTANATGAPSISSFPQVTTDGISLSRELIIALDITSDPKKYDVIIRSDEGIQGDEDHPGNLRMVGIVTQHAAEYQSAREDVEKRSIVTKIQKEIENVDFIDQEDGMHHSYTARFLKPLGNGHYSLDPDGKDIEKEIVFVMNDLPGMERKMPLEPRTYDVIFGREKNILLHEFPGNVRMRKILKEHCYRYKYAPNLKKTPILEEVIEQIQTVREFDENEDKNNIYHGRFLKSLGKGEGYSLIVDGKERIEKVRKAMNKEIKRLEDPKRDTSKRKRNDDDEGADTGKDRTNTASGTTAPPTKPGSLVIPQGHADISSSDVVPDTATSDASHPKPDVIGSEDDQRAHDEENGERPQHANITEMDDDAASSNSQITATAQQNRNLERELRNTRLLAAILFATLVLVSVALFLVVVFLKR